MSDGKQCLLYMVKIPYMEAGIVIMTDFSIVEKQKSANFGFCPREGEGRGGGSQASWDKIPSSADIFWTAPFSKARAPGRKASREERKREREKEEEEGRHFPRVVIP